MNYNHWYFGMVAGGIVDPVVAFGYMMVAWEVEIQHRKPVVVF